MGAYSNWVNEEATKLLKAAIRVPIENIEKEWPCYGSVYDVTIPVLTDAIVTLIKELCGDGESHHGNELALAYAQDVSNRVIAAAQDK